jgi:hypothetical protein
MAADLIPERIKSQIFPETFIRFQAPAKKVQDVTGIKLESRPSMTEA